ncbi:MAG: hypothetical protein FWB88_00935 [Defluviitaleaceae bacterium]|nr:hypothetical protein [Defluviitaleaceae bacterium]MCL2238361.1 hypothetical protein [Defluviitaleaceae bacterium]
MRENPFNPIYKKLNTGLAKTISHEMPLLIDIEVTNACNFNCLFCYTGTKAHKRRTGFMSKELFKKIINETMPYKIPLRFSRWGEPTMHKDILYFLSETKRGGGVVSFEYKWFYGG